jgi:tetratricopeptide (TPR) repeat protein
MIVSLIVSRLASALLVLLVLGAPSAAVSEGNELIQAGIDRTLQGNPDAALALWKRIRERDPSDPAAPVFEVYTLFSLQVADENDTRYDAKIAATTDEAIRLARARVAADENDAEAHFYLGQALFHRARLNGIRGNLYRAGADGERARKSFERALALRPSLVDAKLPLGMYYYYAGLLPGAVKWMSWLWFIPTGESETGLRFLREVHAQGGLYRWDAAFMLMNIYTFHEPDYPKALAVGARLREHYPQNLLIANEYLELLVEACRFEIAIEEALRVEAFPANDAREKAFQGMTRVTRARAELFRERPGQAWEILSGFGADGPDRPYWGSAWLLLTRGQILDAQGRRQPAREHYRRVLGLRPPRGSERATALAEAGLEPPFEPAARKCPAVDVAGSR